MRGAITDQQPNPVFIRLRSALRHLLTALFSRITRSTFAHRHLAPRLAGVQLAIYRRTGNRLHLSALLIPTVIVISRGARTGLRRETPLMCWPLADGTFFVAGSNWGQPAHPAWTANLIAHPDIEIIYRRRRAFATAHLLEGPERDTAWPILEAQWPRYREYEAQAGRPMRIFRLAVVSEWQSIG